MMNRVAFWLRTFTCMPIPTYTILIIWLTTGTVILTALLILILMQIWMLAIWIVDLIAFITKGVD